MLRASSAGATHCNKQVNCTHQQRLQFLVVGYMACILVASQSVLITSHPNSLRFQIIFSGCCLPEIIVLETVTIVPYLHCVSKKSM